MDTPLNNFCCISPVDTGRKLKVHKTFTRRPGRPLNVFIRSIYVLYPGGDIRNLLVKIRAKLPETVSFPDVL